MDKDAIARKLNEIKAELLSLDTLASGARETVTLDQQSVGRLSRMDALQQQAMANAVSERRQADLVRVEIALKRLEEGDYGFCENCEDPIPPKRLEIDPLALRCTNCAGK